MDYRIYEQGSWLNMRVAMQLLDWEISGMVAGDRKDPENRAIFDFVFFSEADKARVIRSVAVAYFVTDGPFEAHVSMSELQRINDAVGGARM